MEKKTFSEKLFLELHKEEFAEYHKKLMLDEIKKTFKFFNEFFKTGEIRTLNKTAEMYESMYRSKNSCNCLSHGELEYKPCFRNIDDDNNIIDRLICLSLYFYLFALENKNDFYFNYSYDRDTFRVESTRFEPICFVTIKGKFKVDDYDKIVPVED